MKRKILNIVQCRDCKYFRKSEILYCERPHPLTGEKYDVSKFCQNERNYGKILARLVGACGKEARFFEPNDEV